MGSIILAVDHDRGILYVNDAEEPEGIMAFSLSTGERIRVLPAREGDGPHEFSQGHTGMTMGPAGRVYVSGLLRVIEFDSTGVPVSSWTPRAPTSKLVCNFGGQPAIPAQYGVIRRGPGGADEGIGPNVVNSHVLMPREIVRRALAIERPDMECTDRLYGRRSVRGDATTPRVRIACSFTTAAAKRRACRFRPSSPRTSPSARGGAGLSNGVVLPDRPCPTWNQRLYPSLDGRGNIVLMGNHRAVAGAIVDPETGWYAVLRKSTPDPTLRVARIYADSALVFTRDAERTTEGGVARTVVYTGANRVSLHAVRRVSGEGCGGVGGDVRWR